MTHLPYIISAYALFVVVVGGFVFAAWRRGVRARQHLAALDQLPSNPR